MSLLAAASAAGATGDAGDAGCGVGGGSFTANFRPAADLNEPPSGGTDGSDRLDWTDRQEPSAPDGERSGVSSDARNARDAGDVGRGVGAAHLPRIFFVQRRINEPPLLSTDRSDCGAFKREPPVEIFSPFNLCNPPPVSPMDPLARPCTSHLSC